MHSLILSLDEILFAGILWYEEALSKLNCGMRTHIHMYTYILLKWYLRAKNILLFHWTNVFLVFRFSVFLLHSLIQKSGSIPIIVSILLNGSLKIKIKKKETNQNYDCSNYEHHTLYKCYEIMNRIFCISNIN